MASAAVSREAFGSRAGFILAAAGSAVGVGNMWRFSYQASEGGGAAFVLLYVVMTILLGIPLMLGEFGLGRRHMRTAADKRNAIDELLPKFKHLQLYC